MATKKQYLKPGASIYIYDLEYSKRRRLCTILDVGDQWKQLAGEIGLSVLKIQHLALELQRMHGSPTDKLLTNWGHSNATADMLVYHLLRLNLRHAADVLRGVVPDSVFNGGVAGTACSGPTEYSVASSHETTGASAAPLGPVDESGLPLPPLDSGPIQDSDQGANKLDSIEKNAVCHRCSSSASDGASSAMDTRSDNLSPPGLINFYHPDSKLTPQGKMGLMSKPMGDCGTNPRRQPVIHHEAVESSDSSGTLRVDMPARPSVADSAKSSLNPTILDCIIQYKYSDIVNATRNFHADNLIGQGGFGNVYKGNIKSTVFAIKVLNKKEGAPDSNDFSAEVRALQKFRHKNIIMLSGCCLGEQVCLVYEYMVNGSLQDRLEYKNCTRPLQWQRRLTILKDAATGLHYLHTVDSKPLIHGDIKSANILLGRHLDAKISDFGLAKEATGGQMKGNFTHVTRSDDSSIYGSKAYLPYDFFTGGCQFSIRTDAYSFGIVIFETCTGEKAYDPRREGGRLLKTYVEEISNSKNDNKLVQIRDANASNWPNDLWLRLMKLGERCSAKLKKNRPVMAVVQEQLEGLVRDSQKINAGSRPLSDQLSNGSQDFSNGSGMSSHHGSAAGRSLKAGNNDASLSESDIAPVRHSSALGIQKEFDLRNGRTSWQNDGSQLDISEWDAVKHCGAVDPCNDEHGESIFESYDARKLQHSLDETCDVSNRSHCDDPTIQITRRLEGMSLPLDDPSCCKVSVDNCKGDEDDDEEEPRYENNEYFADKPVYGDFESTKSEMSDTYKILMDKKKKPFPDFLFASESMSSGGNDVAHMMESMELRRMKEKPYPDFFQNLLDDDDCESRSPEEPPQSPLQLHPAGQFFIDHFPSPSTDRREPQSAPYQSQYLHEANLQAGESCGAHFPSTQVTATQPVYQQAPHQQVGSNKECGWSSVEPTGSREPDSADEYGRSELLPKEDRDRIEKFERLRKKRSQ